MNENNNKEINIINRIIYEKDVHEYILKNYRDFGIKKIIKSQFTGTPDIIAIDNHGKLMNIEIEMNTYGLMKHLRNGTIVKITHCFYLDNSLNFINFCFHLRRFNMISGEIKFKRLDKLIKMRDKYLKYKFLNWNKNIFHHNIKIDETINFEVTGTI